MTNGALNVTNVSIKDHTRYQCAFQSSFFATPSIIELNVQYKPTDTQLSSSSEPVEEGKSLVITCTARANPSAEYKFYRNNKLISSSSTGVLTFVSAKNDDQGTYRCVPHNILGEGPQATITVTVKDEEMFPIWAYGAIGGGVLCVVLIASLIAFCRARKKQPDTRGKKPQNNVSRQGNATGAHIGPAFYGQQMNGGREIGHLNGALSFSDVRINREIPVAMKGAMSANDIRLGENTYSTIQEAYPTRSVIQLIEAGRELDTQL
ncbi:hypothetical protein OS493_024250 [Desmophyllum pertusum]|nr:hypothetical protein OS493_024250 [Desmophyllum pertusum]